MESQNTHASIQEQEELLNEVLKDLQLTRAIQDWTEPQEQTPTNAQSNAQTREADPVESPIQSQKEDQVETQEEDLVLDLLETESDSPPQPQRNGLGDIAFITIEQLTSRIARMQDYLTDIAVKHSLEEMFIAADGKDISYHIPQDDPDVITMLKKGRDILDYYGLGHRLEKQRSKINNAYDKIEYSKKKITYHQAQLLDRMKYGMAMEMLMREYEAEAIVAEERQMAIDEARTEEVMARKKRKMLQSGIQTCEIARILADCDVKKRRFSESDGKKHKRNKPKGKKQ